MGRINLNFESLFPKQMEFIRTKQRYVLYGGARGGGKSHVTRADILKKAIEYPKIRIMLFRQQWGQLEKNHLEELREMIEGNGLGRYIVSKRRFVFTNGSTLTLMYIEYDKDIKKVKGLECDVAYVDEASEFPEEHLRYIDSIVRGAKLVPSGPNKGKPYPKQLRFMTNPDGPSYAYLKRVFVDREFEEDENPDDYYFIKALVFDNEAFKKADPEGFEKYVAGLKKLPPHLRDAHLYGSWEITSGAMFSNFKKDKHTFKDNRVPPERDKYVVLDYGFDMGVALFVSMDTKGKMWVHHEIHVKNINRTAFFQQVFLKARATRWRTRFAILPQDMKKRNQDTGEDGFDKFRQITKMMIREANRDRVNGWQAMYDAIEDERIAFHVSCVNAIKYIPQIQKDKKNPSDCALKPHYVTHVNDCVRYLVMASLKPTTLIDKADKDVNRKSPLSTPKRDDFSDHHLGMEVDDFVFGGDLL